MKNLVSFADFYASIWNKVPEVWRDSDRVNGNPLQIIVMTMAQQMYYNFYVKLASLDELFDLDKCPDRYLPFLANMIDWKLVGADPSEWRQQIRSAPLLYKLKGTKKGLVLAEKLVGYSIFISELYRDYEGNFTPKEGIFNSFPDSIRKKPWFIQTSNSVNDVSELPLLSDALPSVKIGESYLDSDGNLIIYKKYKVSNQYTTTVSTKPLYDVQTGANYITRLAKTSRVNIVLKKITELDEPSSSGILNANLSGALDLLLKFKPFHIYINDLLVLMDLSDYTYPKTSENLLNIETAEISVNLNDKEYESINYYNQTLDNVTPSTSIESISTSVNKGSLVAKVVSLASPNTFTVETSREYITSTALSSLGLNTAEFPITSITLQEVDEITSLRSILGTLPISDTGWPTSIQSLTTTGIPYGDSVTISGTTQSKSNQNPWDLLAISNLLPQIHLPTIPSNNGNAYEIHTLYNVLDYVRSLYIKDFLVLINNVSFCYIMKKHIDYTIDFLSDKLIINTYNLANSFLASGQTGNLATVSGNTVTDSTASWYSLNLMPNAGLISFDFGTTWSNIESVDTDTTLIISDPPTPGTYQYLLKYANSTVLDGCSIYLLYITKENQTESDFSLTSGNRNISITSRKHKKFNRVTWKQNLDEASKRDTAHSTLVYNFDTDGNLAPDLSSTKLFKSPLTQLFTRNSIHKEELGNYSAIQYDMLDPYNQKKWQVYAEGYGYYLGAELIGKSLWANYFNIPVTSSPTWLSYSSIDTSAQAQLTGASSQRWQSILASIDYTNPLQFIASRSTLNDRQKYWTRGSANRIPVPYIGNSRANVQGYRKDTALFNRTENLSDYAITNSGSSSISRYRYGTPTNLDYTPTYMLFENTDSSVIPTPNILANMSYTKILFDGTVQYPVINKYPHSTISYTPEYQAAFDFTDRTRYYNSTGTIKPSLYSGNLRTDLEPGSHYLLDDSADTMNISIDGSILQTITATISDLNTRAFSLVHKNIFILWQSVQTGDCIGYGLIPPVTQILCKPSITVLLNGSTELTYGTQWSIVSTSPRVRIQLDPSVSLSIGDTVTINYSSLDSQIVPRVPHNPTTGAVYDTTTSERTTSSYSFTSQDLKYATQKLMSWKFDRNPIISWYDSSTGLFIDTDVAVDPTEITPVPLFNISTAIPDVQVFINGIQRSYVLDWIFYAAPDTISYNIYFTSDISCKLAVGDILTVEYNALK